MDAAVARKIGKYAEVFFHMLFKESEDMCGEPLRVPKRIRKATDEDIQANNSSLRFICECYSENNNEVMNINPSIVR